MHGDLAHIGECLLALGSQRHMHLFFILLRTGGEINARIASNRSAPHHSLCPLHRASICKVRALASILCVLHPLSMDTAAFPSLPSSACVAPMLVHRFLLLLLLQGGCRIGLPPLRLDPSPGMESTPP